MTTISQISLYIVNLSFPSIATCTFVLELDVWFHDLLPYFRENILILTDSFYQFNSRLLPSYIFLSFDFLCHVHRGAETFSQYVFMNGFSLHDPFSLVVIRLTSSVLIYPFLTIFTHTFYVP